MGGVRHFTWKRGIPSPTLLSSSATSLARRVGSRKGHMSVTNATAPWSFAKLGTTSGGDTRRWCLLQETPQRPGLSTADGPRPKKIDCVFRKSCVYSRQKARPRFLQMLCDSSCVALAPPNELVKCEMVGSWLFLEAFLLRGGSP